MIQQSGNSQSGGGSAGNGGTEIQVLREQAGSGGDESGGTDLNILPVALVMELSSAAPVQQLLSLDLLAVQEVLEPESDILFIAGLCAAGLMLRRRK